LSLENSLSVQEELYLFDVKLNCLLLNMTLNEKYEMCMVWCSRSITKQSDNMKSRIDEPNYKSYYNFSTLLKICDTVAVTGKVYLHQQMGLGQAEQYCTLCLH
jgi:hypothetical protein